MDGRSRAARQWQKAYTDRILAYYEALLYSYRYRLTPADRAEYDDFERDGWRKFFPGREHYPGDHTWPGWRKYIGPPPWEQKQ